MRQRQLPFAAQNHRTQRAVNVQQPRQIRRAHVVRVQKVLQGVQRGYFGRVELRVFRVVIFNQSAEQVEIILLVWRQLVSVTFSKSTLSWIGRGVSIRHRPV